MNPQTVAALKRLNHNFYETYSSDFSSTRTLPWVGWRQALDTCRDSWGGTSNSRPASILDVGCGNGRFGHFLELELDASFDYVGVDNSDRLLAIAAENLPTLERGRRSFLHVDVASPDLSSADFGTRFQLISACGVLHHIPAYHLRQRLIRCLIDALEPEGLMILSFWQFGSKSRFLERIISWKTHNTTAAERLDIEELEVGDFLLPWGENGPRRLGPHSPMALRYCHYSDPEESARLINELSVEVLDSFSADGKTHDLNLYYVLRKRF